MKKGAPAFLKKGCAPAHPWSVGYELRFPLFENSLKWFWFCCFSDDFLFRPIRFWMLILQPGVFPFSVCPWIFSDFFSSASGFLIHGWTNDFLFSVSIPWSSRFIKEIGFRFSLGFLLAHGDQLPFFFPLLALTKQCPAFIFYFFIIVECSPESIFKAFGLFDSAGFRSRASIHQSR